LGGKRQNFKKCCAVFLFSIKGFQKKSYKSKASLAHDFFSCKGLFLPLQRTYQLLMSAAVVFGLMGSAVAGADHVERERRWINRYDEA
jgi:hypothetical protein